MRYNQESKGTLSAQILNKMNKREQVPPQPCESPIMETSGSILPPFLEPAPHKSLYYSAVSNITRLTK